MKPIIQFKTTTPPLLIALLLACFGLLPGAQATDLDSVLPNGNTADGSGVLVSLTSGVWNSGFGFQALNHNTAGKDNTATGVRALFSNTGGNYNSATGVYALYANINGWYNNAVGAYALANNISGNYNTANGYGALFFNTEGDGNTATGFGALYRTTTGYSNTANGYIALNRTTTGFSNTANGNGALYSNTTGFSNTANGNGALYSNTTGGGNTANGFFALGNNTTGNTSTALGFEAGLSVTTASNVICIGANLAGANVTNSCFIGNIRGIQTANNDAIPVLIDSAGQLGTMSSSRRFKKEIKPMDKASESILALKPVTFHYNSDTKDTRQFGLIAEEVAEVNPDLVVRDKKGEIYTVRYDAVNAMLLNEFLKEHRKVQELQANFAQQREDFQSAIAQQRNDFEAATARQQKEVQALTASLTEQAAQIQKVSARIEVGKSAPQTVLNNR